MELILAVIILIIVFSIGFMVGTKQSQKLETGYYQPWVDPDFKHQPTASFNTTPLQDEYDTMGTIGSKPKTQTDYQMEHKAEVEKGDIDFMRNWIQEKSGKKDPIPKKENPKQFNGIKTEEPFVKTRTKRKPKSIKDWEDEFDIGGNS